MRSKEQVTFRAHLDQCHRCLEAVEELRVVSRPLRSLQWPALIGAPVIAYGGKVIGVIRRVVTAKLLTTASAAAVTVATVGVATDKVPFEPFDAGADEPAGTTGSDRSAVVPALTSVIPTVALGGATTVAPPATISLAGATVTAPTEPTTTAAATPGTTVPGPTALAPEEPSPATTVPAPPTTEASAPAGGPVGGSETQSATDGGPPTTAPAAPTTTAPGGIVVTPIGGNPQTQSDGPNDGSSMPPTTTEPAADAGIS
jgi:hypothetical protein